MDWNALEESWLLPYAMHSRDSLGRQHTEASHPYRSIFQRDRERIVHCTAFRRLMGKTQVLVGQINDHHRTRLTHTLEVAQISRTIARRLRLNEDLTEAIALSHDMGHPPFGHAGEYALDECMSAHGGFDHNLYGLRRVDYLEDRYPDFPGLNLSWEVREAFVQHSKKRSLAEIQPYLQQGSPFLEAQLVDAADSLAYDTHDTDDALGIGLITLEDLESVEMWRRMARVVREQNPQLRGEGFRAAVIRELIAQQVEDLSRESEQRLKRERIETLADVRAFAGELIGFSPEWMILKAELERFLHNRVYRDYRVMRMAAQGKRLLTQIFWELVSQPELLPDRHLRRWQKAPERVLRPTSGVVLNPEDSLERVVADYLAGMTDRFARQEYLRLFQVEVDL